MSKPTVQEVYALLDQVYDPEIGIPITQLGLVYDVVIAEDLLQVDYTLTYHGCPLGEMIEKDIATQLESIAHTENVRINQVWDPPWGPEMMSDEARLDMGYPI